MREEDSVAVWDAVGVRVQVRVVVAEAVVEGVSVGLRVGERVAVASREAHNGRLREMPPPCRTRNHHRCWHRMLAKRRADQSPVNTFLQLM